MKWYIREFKPPKYSWFTKFMFWFLMILWNTFWWRGWTRDYRHACGGAGPGAISHTFWSSKNIRGSPTILVVQIRFRCHEWPNRMKPLKKWFYISRVAEVINLTRTKLTQFLFSLSSFNSIRFLSQKSTWIKFKPSLYAKKWGNKLLTLLLI
jgi:hypothetical protein